MRRETNDRVDRLLDDLEQKRQVARAIAIVMPIVLLIGLVIFGAFLFF